MRPLRILIPAFFAALLVAASFAQAPVPFRFEETTIAQIESAFRDGSLTCRSLVEQYLTRIDAYDKRRLALIAIVLVNTGAVKAAEDLGRRLRQSVRSIRCIACPCS